MKKKKDAQDSMQTVADKQEKRKSVKSQILYWLVLNFGILLIAFGVFLFKGPNNFATGGVSGITIIISNYVTPLVPFLTQSVLNFILNGVLLIIGFIFLGKGCTFKTAYCSIAYTLEMYAMEWIFKSFGIEFIDGVVITALKEGQEGHKFLEFIYAMLLTGIGSAILFNCRASSGGTDIIALIIKKYAKLDIGKALFVTDFLIASSTFFIFGITTGLYSILGLFFKAFLVDGVIESMGKSKCITIITSKPELITPFIIEGLHRGYTSYKGVGGYTGEEKTVIITVSKRSEALKLKMKILEVDKESFVIITDSTEIFGKGFKTTL